MLIADARAAILRNLGGTALNWPHELVDGGLQRAIDDLNRVLPRERLHDARLVFRFTDEARTSDHDVWVTLANKRIRAKTVTVTGSGGTPAYKINTDFLMDYAGGRIQALSTGAIPDATALEITYTVMEVYIDLSGLTDLTRVYRVEYPAGDMAARAQTFYTWDGFLVITGLDQQSQQALAENEHVWVYYQAEHIMPTIEVPGTWPPHLDEVLIKGAEAYVLITKAVSTRLSAQTRVESAGVALSKIAAALTSAEAALVSANTQSATAATDLDGVAAYVTTLVAALEAVAADLVSAERALDSADTAAGNAITDLANVDADLASARAALASIGGVLVGALSRLNDASSYLAQAKSDLDNVDTELSTAAIRMTSALTQLAGATAPLANITARIADANAKIAISVAILDKADTAIAAALVEGAEVIQWLYGGDEVGQGANALIVAAVPLINRVNVGEGVAELYTRLAEVSVESGRLRHDVQEDRLDQADKYTNEGMAYVRMAEVHLVEADRYIAEVKERIDYADGFIRAAEGHYAAANTRVNQGQGRTQLAAQVIAEAAVRGGTADRYAQEARGYIDIARVQVEAARIDDETVEAYLGIAARHIDMAQARIAEANARNSPIAAQLQLATQRVAISQSFQGEAQRYMDEAGVRQGEADRYVSLATVELDIAQRYDIGGEQRVLRFIGVLTDRAQLRMDTYLVATKQQAPGGPSGQML